MFPYNVIGPRRRSALHIVARRAGSGSRSHTERALSSVSLLSNQAEEASVVVIKLLRRRLISTDRGSDQAGGCIKISIDCRKKIQWQRGQRKAMLFRQ